ncbi:MAG: CehA/McbA family metallohydrolase [Lentisphaerae bacterium]|nr:CehA/McbA family metallohydrolase [Lentisphaerota bacterium]MBT5611306.1 CehA/McbA family metallohydrolase [Lentisphaerota bacterium]MBT7054787.1 CehA/McbA family metallohydrolase [Lentisphaerota bacterium]MBT7846812.1 CehA/McbA family metallohydrolase [Lentisphaerota bacterium]
MLQTETSLGRKVRGPWLFCGVLLTALWFSGGVPAEGQLSDGRRDILTNGGFEDGDAGWEFDKGHVLVSGDQAHGGAACVTGEILKPKQFLQLTRRVKVSGGCLYEFQFWARATNRTKVVLWTVKPGQKGRSRAGEWKNLPNTWTKCRTPVAAGGDGVLQLQIIAPSSYDAPAGRVWVDDFSLIETRLPKAPQLTDGQGWCDEPAMAQAGDGSLYVVWNGFRDGSDSLRVGRWLDSSGASAAKAGEWQIAGGKGVYVLNPTILAGTDSATVFYSQEQSETDWDLMVTTVTAAGPQKPVRLAGGAGVDVKPAACRVSGGVVWLAWESNQSGSRRVVAAPWRDGKLGAIEELSPAGVSSYSPSIAVLPDETVCVAWHSYAESNYDVFMARRTPVGKWTAPARLTRAPAVDRHAFLFTCGEELWLAYEHTTMGRAYRVAATGARRLIIAQVTSRDQLLVLKGLASSPLKGRCEAPSAAFDSAGRLWVAHLRPRLPRAGWDTFLTGYAGGSWLPLRRVSAAKGMDRRPWLVLKEGKALVLCQSDNLPETWSKVSKTAESSSELHLATVELPPAGDVSPPLTEPLIESDVDSGTATLRTERGEDIPSPTIEYRGDTLRLFYGDLHHHSNVSVCNRLGDQTIDESYQHMRDPVSLDFACVTDHGYNINPYLWGLTAKMARVCNDPDRFLTFLGEEWTSSFEKYSEKHPYGFHGHRNLILEDAYFPRWWNANNGQTPAEVWSELRAMKASFVQIPHQIGDTGNVPTDWDYTDEDAQPVAEIYQTRGSYEYKGTPREAPRSTPGGRYFIQDAWARGIVIGVIASPDHGGGRGKACVYAKDLTRAGILEGLRARRCFGTTSSRMALDVRVNGHLMGEKIPASGGKPVEITVVARCPAAIDRVEICRNNQFIYCKRPDGNEASVTFVDSEPLNGRSYYYVRVIQKDEEIGWSSPVWLGY